jgi:DNA-binding Lrp family transcriptional regulator
MSTTEPIDELSDDERQGLQLINGSGGIHQSEFWKELDFSSRKGSRIVSSLLEAELINREETVYEGQRTYYLEPSAEQLDFQLLIAGDVLSPVIGEEEIDLQGDALSQWLMNLQYEGRS